MPPGFKIGTNAQLSSVGPAAVPITQDYRSAPTGPILAALNLWKPDMTDITAGGTYSLGDRTMKLQPRDGR